MGLIATIGGRFRCAVEVRVRLAGVFGGSTAVRARPAAATMRASAFGHATMFVMGCVLALSLRLQGRCVLAVLLWIKRSHVSTCEPVKATNDARRVRFGIAA